MRDNWGDRRRGDRLGVGVAVRLGRSTLRAEEEPDELESWEEREGCGERRNMREKNVGWP